MSDFDINDAIGKYNDITARYRDNWIDQKQAEYEIEALNKQCEDEGVVFKASFKSLELFSRDDSYEEDESYSWDDDSYF